MIQNRLLLFIFTLTLISFTLFAEANDDLIAGIKSGNLQKVKDAISTGANPDTKDESGLSAFLLSISKGNKQIIQYYLSLEADFKVKDSEGNSALHYLAKTSDTAMAESLLEKGLNVNETNASGQTPLLIAISKKQSKMVSVLIKSKPDLNKKDSNGNSSLILAYNVKLLQTFEELLKAGASPDTTDKNGNTLLHLMLAEGNIKSAKSLLSLVPTLLNVQNNDGKTPLLFSLEKNKEQSFSFLMEQSPDVKILDNTKSSVLHYLAKSNYSKYINQVIIKGADPNLVNQDGDTPLFLAIKNNKLPAFKELIANNADIKSENSEGDNSIILVVKSANLLFLKPLMEMGADINTKTKDKKSLLLLAHENLLKAATQARSKMFLELIQNGADLNITTSSNKSLLLEYIEKGNAEIVRFLIDKGASKDTLSKDGNNLLHVSCILGKEEVSKVLIEKGFSINVKGNGGNTPLLFAVHGGFTQLAVTLLKKGSTIDEKNNLGDSAISIAVAKQDLKTIKELLSFKPNLNTTNSYGNSLLMEVAKTEPGNAKNTFEITSLLLKNGANVNAQNSYGNTALSYAINRKNRKLIEFFLKEGADPNLNDFSGNTPLHKLIFTAVYDRIKNQELEDLIQIFYNYKSDLNAMNKDGLTPLIIAVKQEVDKDTVAGLQSARKLLDLSADPFLKNSSGKSALDYMKDSSEKSISSLPSSYFDSNKIDKDFNPVLPNSSFADRSVNIKVVPKGNVYHLVESNEKKIINKHSDSGNPISTIKLNQSIDFTIDLNENLYILGITLEKIEGVADTSCKVGDGKIISIRKLNSTGDELWLKYFSEKGACSKTKPLGIISDEEGNIYYGISFGINSHYLVKLSPSGELLWKEKILESFKTIQIIKNTIYYIGNKVNQVDLSGKKGISLKLGKPEETTSISYDLFSNSYYTIGKTRLSLDKLILFISKFDQASKLDWTKYFSSTGDDNPVGILTDAEGNVYVYGETSGDLHGKKNSGGKDVFVFKLDSKGNRVWTELIGSTKDDFVIGISLDSKNQLLIHGMTEGKLSNSANQGLTDVFLFRLNK